MPEGNTRIASFFKTKRANLLVGSSNGEQLDLLINTIKAAKVDGKGITFFFWLNEPGSSKVVAGLTVAVERDREQGEVRGRPIGAALPVERAPAPAPKKADPLAGLFGASEKKATGGEW